MNRSTASDSFFALDEHEIPRDHRPMSNAASTGDDRVQLLVMVNATDTLAGYCVLSIHPMLLAATALVRGPEGSVCIDHPAIDLAGEADAKQESLAAWIDRKQRRRSAVLSAA